jgi:hypothetical protein
LRTLWPFSMTFSRTLKYHHLPLILIESFCMVALYAQVYHRLGIRRA